MSNFLQKYVEDEKLVTRRAIRKPLDERDLQDDFPKLFKDQQRIITLGVYQRYRLGHTHRAY